MYCPNCGKQNPDGCRFCTNCGTSLNNVPQPTGNNKKRLFIASMALLLIAGGIDAYLSGKAPAEVEAPVVADDGEQLTEKVVERLWNGIPDHGMNDKSANSLSKKFYKLCDVAFAIPSDNPGGIGSEELMWYWYTAQDSGENDRISSVSIDSVDGDKATVTVTYLVFDTPANYKLELVRESVDGNTRQWRIDNFISSDSDMGKCVYDYVCDLGVKFKNGYGEQIIAEASEYMTDADKQQYRQAVEKFIKKFDEAYPDGKIER